MAAPIVVVFSCVAASSAANWPVVRSRPQRAIDSDVDVPPLEPELALDVVVSTPRLRTRRREVASVEMFQVQRSSDVKEVKEEMREAKLIWSRQLPSFPLLGEKPSVPTADGRSCWADAFSDSNESVVMPGRDADDSLVAEIGQLEVEASLDAGCLPTPTLSASCGSGRLSRRQR